MNTAGPAKTTKRKRRRYSCGPCKTLKIKCDLQTPCAACTKVGREAKCHEDPPMPPSNEELNISNRRKNLSMRKKQLAALSEEQATVVSEKNLQKRQLDRRSVKDEDKKYSETSDPKNRSDNSSSNSQLQIDSKVSTHRESNSSGNFHEHTHSQHIRNSGTEVKGMRVPPRSTSRSSLYASVLSTPISDNQISPPSAVRGESLSSSITTSSFTNQDSGYICLHPNVNNYQYYDIYLQQDPKDINSYCAQLAEYPFNSNNFLIPQPSNSASILGQNQSIPPDLSLIETEHMNSKRIMYAFNNNDLSILKTFLPPFPLLEELQNQYKLTSSNSYYNVLNHDEILAIFKDFYILLHELSPTDTVKIDKYSLKNISKFFCIMAISYLLSGWDSEIIVNLDKLTVIQGWINISSMIRCVIVDPSQISDVLFSIEWYFIVRDLFTYTDRLLDDYASFCSIINLSKLNPLFLESIKKKSNEPLTNLNPDIVPIIEYWIHLRIIDLEVPYIMHKGIFINSKEFENSYVPDKQSLDYLYRDLNNISEPLRNISHGIMKLYFNRTQSNASIKLFLISYLDFFCDVDLLMFERLEYFKSASLKPKFELTNTVLSDLIKNQYCSLVTIKWLSFVNIEWKYYFPSLRITSYLTTVATLFNHFINLDKIIMRQTQNTESLVDRLIENFSYMSFLVFVRSLVYQGIFLITIHNFKDMTDSVIDCCQLFHLIKDAFYSAFSRFWNNERFQRQMYTTLPLFRKLLDLCHEFCRIVDADRKHTSLDDFMAYLESTLRTYDFLSQSLFASTDSFKCYVDILWRMFEYLKTTTSDTKIPLSDLLCMNTDLINKHSHELRGFSITASILKEYSALVIEPKVTE